MAEMSSNGQLRGGATAAHQVPGNGEEKAMQDYFAMLARYHVWANEKLLAAVAALDESHYRRDCGLFFGSVHGTLNHLLVGETLWHARFAGGAVPQLALNAELETERAALAQALGAAVARWGDWLRSVPASCFGGRLDYGRISGEAVSVPFAGTLGHMFNHGTHHRGQISAAMTAMGYPCPELDLVYFLVAEGNK